MKMGRKEVKGADLPDGDGSPGIVVTDRHENSRGSDHKPRIAAFIWGGKVRPSPTLPYGRWKGAA
jgi:hypothetical protein